MQNLTATTRDRVALVTGSARGIGRAIALALAQQGRRVAVADILCDQAKETAREIESMGGHSVALHLDVSDARSVGEAFQVINETLGPVEILVNNAGWDERIRFIDTNEDFWRRVITINFVGVLRTSKAAFPTLIDRRCGRIVKIGAHAVLVGSTRYA